MQGPPQQQVMKHIVLVEIKKKNETNPWPEMLQILTLVEKSSWNYLGFCSSEKARKALQINK